MCEPATISALSLALSAASAGLAYSEGNKTAKIQEDSLKESAELQNIQTAQVYEQQNQSAMDETSQRHIEWIKELGRMRTIGAESGLTGLTEGRLENEAESAAQKDISTIEANRLRSTQQTGSTSLSQSRQTAAAIRGVGRPSLVGTGLQIAGAGVDAYSGYRKATKETTK